MLTDLQPTRPRKSFKQPRVARPERACWPTSSLVPWPRLPSIAPATGRSDLQKRRQPYPEPRPTAPTARFVLSPAPRPIRGASPARRQGTGRLESDCVRENQCAPRAPGLRGGKGSASAIVSGNPAAARTATAPPLRRCGRWLLRFMPIPCAGAWFAKTKDWQWSCARWSARTRSGGRDRDERVVLEGTGAGGR